MVTFPKVWVANSVLCTASACCELSSYSEGIVALNLGQEFLHVTVKCDLWMTTERQETGGKAGGKEAVQSEFPSLEVSYRVSEQVLDSFIQKMCWSQHCRVCSVQSSDVEMFWSY